MKRTPPRDAKGLTGVSKRPAQSRANDPPVVGLGEFTHTLLSSVRGDMPMPRWAGKTVYASEQARAFWKRDGGELDSLASFAKLISENHDLLAEIDRGNATSIAEIARAIDRQQSNVSRSLSKLEKCGVVRLDSAAEGGRAKTPRIVSRKMYFQVDIVSGDVALASLFNERKPHAGPAKTNDKQQAGHALASAEARTRKHQKPTQVAKGRPARKHP